MERGHNSPFTGNIFLQLLQLWKSEARKNIPFSQAEAGEEGEVWGRRRSGGGGGLGEEEEEEQCS